MISIIVGNKKDLKDKRQISFEEGLKFTKKHDIPFFETSAKNNINIDNLFDFIARTFM